MEQTIIAYFAGCRNAELEPRVFDVKKARPLEVMAVELEDGDLFIFHASR